MARKLRVGYLAQGIDDLLLRGVLVGGEPLLHRQEVLEQLRGDGARVVLLAVVVGVGHPDEGLQLRLQGRPLARR